MRIVHHIPSINQLDVARNLKIEVHFDEPLDKNTLTYTAASLNDQDYKVIEGQLRIEYSKEGVYEGIPNILSFTPKSALDPNFVYTFFVYRNTDGLRSTDGSFLEATYKFKFTTGITILDDVSVPYEENDIERIKYLINDAISKSDYDEASRLIEQLNIVLSGQEIPPPVDLISLNEKINIISTDPMNEQPNVDVHTKFIRISFDDIPDIAGYDLGSVISVSYKNVLE